MADEPFEEASLDDFFQPPTDEEFAPGAPAAGTPKHDVASQDAGPNPLPVPVDDEEDFNAVTQNSAFDAADPLAPPVDEGGGGFATGASTAGDEVNAFASTLGQDPGQAAAPQVEELPITDHVEGRGADKKKIIVIAAAAVVVLLLLGVGAMFILGGDEVPEPDPMIAEDIGIDEPTEIPSTPPPIPDLNVERLSDLDQSPTTTHFAGSKLYDAGSGGLSEDGRGKIASLPPPLSLYVGTFVVPGNLDAAKERVRKAGLKPIVRETRSKVKMHRLHVGNYETYSSAKTAYRKLMNAGFDAFITRPAPGRYEVYAGSFFTETKAREYSDRLFSSASGFVGELTTARVELPNWTLWAGSYDNVDALEEPLVAMLQSGVEVDVAAGR